MMSAITNLGKNIKIINIDQTYYYGDCVMPDKIWPIIFQSDSLESITFAT